MRSVCVFILLTSLANAQGYDLPIPPVKFGDDKLPPIQYDPDDGTDPSDTPPPVFYGEELDTDSDSIVYVLDISCSMSLEGRLGKAVAELTASVSGLADSMRFNILAYDCTTKVVFSGLQEAIPPNKQAAIAWAEALTVGGSTGTGPAVAQALKMAPDNLLVVLLTDGAPNCGVPFTRLMSVNKFGALYLGASGHRALLSLHRQVITSNNRQGATINVFGIDARSTFRSFCQGVASDAHGIYVDVP